MRIPLITKVDLVIHRLDAPSTWAYDPNGTPSKGYDDLLNEPVIAENPSTYEWESSRQEYTAIRIPCQMETPSFQYLNVVFGGDQPDSNIVFVTHRYDLENLNLIDSNGDCLLNNYDRISHLEQYKMQKTIKTFKKPLFIFEARPGSWGCGGNTRGQDLYMLFTTHKSAGPYVK